MGQGPSLRERRPSAIWRAGVLFFQEGDTREVPKGGFFSYPALQHFHPCTVNGHQRLVTPSREPTQVRGVLAERVIVSMPLDPFLSLKALASYSGLSVRKLRQHLGDLNHPLPSYRVGGKIVVRRSEFDAWMARYRQQGRVDVEGIVRKVLSGL